MNPLTWQNPEQLFVAQVLKKIFYNSVAELRVDTYYDAGYENEERKETIEFKIYLYKLSKEMYTYLKSLNRINNNDLGGYGLAPIRSHYTNVENGIGLLGGCNVYESEWISNPKE